jgi:putative membrane protein
MTLACIIAVFLFFSLLYFNFLDSPLRKAIGASGRDFIRGYISENQREVEKFFNKFGRIGKIPISIIAIESESGKGREMKSIWVVPSVHPGPIGSAGSGNLPSKLSEILGENTFVFHGCGGYDFSMVRAEEIEKICDFVGEKLSGMNFSMVATRSIRVGNIVAQRFGGSLLFIFSPPFRCGDLDFSLSLLIPPDSVLIDSHSSGEGKDLILPGKNSYELMRDVERAAALLKKEEEGNVKIGISSRKFRNEDLLGMKIAVVEVLGQRTAYVLLDGNNLVSGLSEYLSIGETIILTTDTHVINVKKVYNPVGSITDGEELRRKIVEGIREATIDLEPVLVGMKKDFIDLEILYPGTTAKILTALTFIRFLAPILAVMTGMVAVIVSSLLLHFFC